jgi:osmotically-inducible protein OsmY
MLATHPILESIRKALEHHPRIRLTWKPVRLSLEGAVLILEGEVKDVASKKLLLELAAATHGVAGIVDRLHVAPSLPMSDEAIQEHVVDALYGEPALRDCALWVRAGGQVYRVRPGAGSVRNTVEVRVEAGVVTLDGDISSLAAKRLAGVLAWWVPGVRDVVNGLGVEPPERDSDEEMTEAVHLALEKDPFVPAGEIAVSTRDSVVTLRGVVHAEEQRRMAEADAWYVFGVDRVEKQLAVVP